MHAHEHYLCNGCIVSLPRSNYHRDNQSEMARLLYGRVPVSIAASYFIYEKRGRVQSMLHAIKYHDQKELGEYLGCQYGKELNESGGTDFDVLVPIPLHKKKLRERGYNQSEWFAKGLSAGLGKPIDNVSLYRAVATSTQTRRKKYERWQNVQGIFTVKDPESLKYRHVALVDDVVTTGATIEAAWTALREIPGIRLSILSIAFAARSL